MRARVRSPAPGSSGGSYPSTNTNVIRAGAESSHVSLSDDRATQRNGDKIEKWAPGKDVETKLRAGTDVSARVLRGAIQFSDAMIR